jgi:hypothetical protein
MLQDDKQVPSLARERDLHHIEANAMQDEQRNFPSTALIDDKLVYTNMHTINKNTVYACCQSGDDLNCYLEVIIF